MPKCKNCKCQFEPVRFNQKYCLDAKCIEVWVSVEREKSWKKKKAKIKKELLTLSDYVKLAQQVFNKYIRERDKGGKCISCNTLLVGKFDAGHFYNANNHWSVRFDEDNVNGQCVHCNQHKHGNLLEYRANLIELIGEAKFNALELEAKKTRKYSIDELKEIISLYKSKLKEL